MRSNCHKLQMQTGFHDHNVSMSKAGMGTMVCMYMYIHCMSYQSMLSLWPFFVLSWFHNFFFGNMFGKSFIRQRGEWHMLSLTTLIVSSAFLFAITSPSHCLPLPPPSYTPVHCIVCLFSCSFICDASSASPFLPMGQTERAPLGKGGRDNCHPWQYWSCCLPLFSCNFVSIASSACQLPLLTCWQQARQSEHAHGCIFMTLFSS